MICAIWYHLYNSKNMKNTHGKVSLLVARNFSKSTLLEGCFPRFLNCADGTKSRKATEITCLTHSRPLVSFYTPWKYQKTSGMKIKNWSFCSPQLAEGLPYLWIPPILTPLLNCCLVSLAECVITPQLVSYFV